MNCTWKLSGLAAFLIGVLACTTSPSPRPFEDGIVREHADRAFVEIEERLTSAQSQPTESKMHSDLATEEKLEVPLGQVETRGDMLIATGYALLKNGLTLCQHSADLAARIELSKLVKIEVTEKSQDRQREQTGKDFEQDIEVVREGRVNQVLTEVRIVDRKVDKARGTCVSIAQVPRRTLFGISPSPAAIPSN